MADVNEREKKTSEQIKQRIIEELDKQQKPLSIQDISKEIGSNWLTIKDYIKELQQERKVKEIVLGDKKVFRLVREDTYLDIPITRKEKEIFYFLFDNAKKLFKELGRENPTKTDINKSIIKVIDQFNISVPIVWYLYGKMALLKYEIEKDYATSYIPENYKEILVFFRETINQIAKKKNSKEVREDQYLYYGKTLYQIKEEIYDFILKKDLDKHKEKLKELFSNFLVCLSSQEDFNEINELVSKFVMIIRKMAYLENINSHKKRVIESFDAIWKMIAMYMFYDSLTKYFRFKNKEEIKSMYFEDTLNNKISIAQEMISDLEIEYLNNLFNIKEPPKLDNNELTSFMKNMISEMAKEGVKEDEQIS